MMDIHNPNPATLTYSIAEACRVTSIGRTRLYELITGGRVETVKIGRRRLVKAASLHRLVEAA
ncbi:helix-turn-helix domain-containing protein [Sphingomonas zeae]|jgi:excisionase family DNA binding protein